MVSHGPLHAQNCTPGAGALQTLSLRVRSQGFFASGVGDHLAFGLRANYPTFNALGNEQYEGIGAILHPLFGGVMAERFGYPSGGDREAATPPQVELADGVSYFIEMQADTVSLAYRVTDEESGQSTGWKNYVQPAGRPPLDGTGLLFAFLCRDDNARCEAFDQPFRVDLRHRRRLALKLRLGIIVPARPGAGAARQECPGGDRRRDSPYRPEVRNSLHWRVSQLAAEGPP